MIRQRTFSFSAVAAGISAAGLGLSLGFAPSSSAADLKSAGSGPVHLSARLHVTSRGGAPASSSGLLTTRTPRTVGPAVSASCGSSFVDAIVDLPDNDGKYQEKTGFTGASRAIGYSWAENIVVNYNGQVVDDYTVRQSGGLAFRSSWTGQHTATTPYTPATFTVYVNGSWALSNGVVCYAVGAVSGYIP